MSENYRSSGDPEEPNPSIIDPYMREVMAQDNRLAAEARAEAERHEQTTVAFEKLAEDLAKTIQAGLEVDGKYLGFLTGDCDHGFEYERKDLQKILPGAHLDIDLAVIAEATMCAVQEIIKTKVTLSDDFDPDIFITVHIGDNEDHDDPTGMIVSLSTIER
jgi:hypothetical protein